VTAISGKSFAKALERNGWVLLRINGSHHIYGKTGHTERITVPIHGNQSLKIGLMKSLLKSASLTESDI
jgi:predicted RNA binding protein YcfA (HicA-like mRNA interferase family)